MNSKSTIIPGFLLTSALMVGLAAGNTLVSSALDATTTDLSGSNGIFTGAIAGDTAPEIAGVTTTVVSNFAAGSTNGFAGTVTISLRAVSPANGMDVTYNVNFDPFRFDASASADVAEEHRIVNGFTAVRSFSNDDRESTTRLVQGDGTTDVEFYRISVSNVVSSGATTYSADGVTAVRILNLSGFEVYDSYAGGVSGTLLASAGTGTISGGSTDLSLSSPANSLALLGTSDLQDLDDLGRPINRFSNRVHGISVQFSDTIPEPSGVALLGLACASLALRRRR